MTNPMMHGINVVDERGGPPSVAALKAVLRPGAPVRHMLGWSEVEQTFNQFAIPDFKQRSFENVAAAGGVNFVTLGFGNTLHTKDAMAFPTTTAEIDAFVCYADWVAGSARIPNLGMISIWNELNGSFGGGLQGPTARIAAYVNLMKAVGPAIRWVNPSVRIVIGASVGVFIDRWFIPMARAGLWGINDPLVSLDVHPYLYTEAGAAAFRQSMAAIRAAGIHNGLWASEWGSSDWTDNHLSDHFIPWFQHSIFDQERFDGAAWFALGSTSDWPDAGLVAPPGMPTEIGQQFKEWAA